VRLIDLPVPAAITITIVSITLLCGGCKSVASSEGNYQRDTAITLADGTVIDLNHPDGVVTIPAGSEVHITETGTYTSKATQPSGAIVPATAGRGGASTGVGQQVDQALAAMSSSANIAATICLFVGLVSIVAKKVLGNILFFDAVPSTFPFICFGLAAALWAFPVLLGRLWWVLALIALGGALWAVWAWKDNLDRTSSVPAATQATIEQLTAMLRRTVASRNTAAVDGTTPVGKKAYVEGPLDKQAGT
jgi:hypothetical protein